MTTLLNVDIILIAMLYMNVDEPTFAAEVEIASKATALTWAGLAMSQYHINRSTIFNSWVCSLGSQSDSWCVYRHSWARSSCKASPLHWDSLFPAQCYAAKSVTGCAQCCSVYRKNSGEEGGLCLGNTTAGEGSCIFCLHRSAVLRFLESQSPSLQIL